MTLDVDAPLNPNIHTQIYNAILKFSYKSNTRLERDKFYPEPVPEPGPLALRASALITILSRTITDPS